MAKQKTKKNTQLFRLKTLMHGLVKITLSSFCLFFQTYIGSVLVSVNPYQEVKFYTPYHREKYQGVNFYEVPPHV